MKTKITQFALLLIASLQFCFTHPKQSLTAIGTISAIECKAQFTDRYYPADSALAKIGAWSGMDLYKVKDSTGISTASYIRFQTKFISARSLSNNFGDQIQTKVIMVGPNGEFTKYPIASLIPTTTAYYAGSNLSLNTGTFTNTAPDQVVTLTATNGLTVTGTYPTFTVTRKRSEAYTGTTNGSGVVTFTYAAFTGTPNIQYNPGFGFGNKETCIPNAAPTLTSCSFYVQLRADIIGLLPSYSNVSGREVNIVVSEK